MRARRGLVIAAVLGAALAGCAAPAVRPAATYVVRREDTLYAIAWRHGIDYRDLAAWNGIGPDYRIEVGQVLTLTRPAILPPSRRPPERAAAAVPAAPTPGSAPAHPAAAARRPGGWTWPTVPDAPPRPVPGGGVLLLGQVGQPVRAARAGRVVYVGSGLRGYGNLVIVKHGEDLLSAYAHNDVVLVREGQEVGAGEQIGRMGLGPHRTAALYFEVRVNGKPVDPLLYLPAQPPLTR